MKAHASPYHILAVVVILLLSSGIFTPAMGAKLFLSPDSTFVTSGSGSQFDIEIRVDAATTSLKLFQIDFLIDPSKVDTVSVTEGTFWDTTGALTIFNRYIFGDTLIRLEGLVLGAGEAASGPGLLATVRFKILDTGTVQFTVVASELRNVSNTPVSHTTEGAVLLVNVPPRPFNLVSPANGAPIQGLPGELLTFNWAATTSVYPSDGITYQLQYSKDPNFVLNVVTVNLPGLSHSIDVGILDNAPYYWRVYAISTMFGFSQVSTPSSRSFIFATTPTGPNPFNLLAPANNAVYDLTKTGPVNFDWDNATTPVPNDSIFYIIQFDDEPLFIGTSLSTDTSTVSTLSKSLSLFPRGVDLWWRVLAVNKFALTSGSITQRSLAVYSRGDLDHSGGADIADLTLLVDHLFISFFTPSDPYFRPASDMDCTGGGADIGDLTALVDLLFISFGMPPCP